ncbi:acyl-CoA thioester hydrolase [Pseudorhodoferax soli]|uniref:Acyl-CoA thioester hydrolase n=2 Tax=Pseudorhodoferax soli TaxID=545864 RepID=A0A368XKU5_9BURK|nr:acyl-CoA thioester hydrolase [Pseudorhodoferax soli]
MSPRVQATTRDAYRLFMRQDTRWGDNDSYGHVNNVVYYAFFDTAVNRYLIERGVLDIAKSSVIGLVIETRCTYFSSIGFPDTIDVGLKVVHLGSSSVRYEIALFRNDEAISSAVGEFVHVYVERASNRSTPIPVDVRGVLQSLMA